MIYYRQVPDMEKKNHCGQSEAAKQVLAEGLAAEFEMKEIPEIARELYGKPYFPGYPDIAFSYSHCRRGILCGISRKRIGVDIETVRPYRERVARRVCHAREWELLQRMDDPALPFIKLWVCKEAYGKYTGEGVFRQPQVRDFSDILQGKEEKIQGVFMKIWEADGCILGVCAERKCDLHLIRI